MRAASLFFITLFISWLTLMSGLVAKNPFPNFGIFVFIWFIYYIITGPRRKRKAYRRERRRLQDEYMRTYLHRHRRYH